MNANAAVVVAVSVLLCGVVGASAVQSEPGTMETETARGPSADGGFGGEVSVFMQRGAATANGSVDAGMWLAAFERAENQSRKEELVAQRTETLGVRLDRLERRTDRLPATDNGSVAYQARQARLVADIEALRSAVSEAKTSAASEGVNTSGLDRVSERAAALSVPPADAASRTNDTRSSETSAQTGWSEPRLDHTSVGPSRTAGATYRGP